MSVIEFPLDSGVHVTASPKDGSRPYALRPVFGLDTNTCAVVGLDGNSVPSGGMLLVWAPLLIGGSAGFLTQFEVEFTLTVYVPFCPMFLRSFSSVGITSWDGDRFWK